MPAKGLYSMPRHYVYGGQMARPKFNSMDFKGTTSEPAKPDQAPPEIMDSTKDGQHGDEAGDVKKKRKKKKHSLIKQQGIDEDGTTHKPNKAKIEPKKDKKKAPEELQGHHHTKKKRKREQSGQLPTSPDGNSILANDGLVLKEDMENKEKRRAVPATHSLATPQPVEKPAKDRKSSKNSKGERLDLEETPRAAYDVTAPKGSKKPKAARRKKSGEHVHQNDGTTSKAPTAGQTPVPLPQASMLNAASQPQEAIIPSSRSGVLVPETPPSRKMQKARSFPKGSVPFPQLAGEATAESKPPGKDRTNVSVPTPAGDVRMLPSTPAAIIEPQNTASVPSIPNALTDANLSTLRPWLKPQPKQKLRSKRGSTSLGSQPESTGSSMSIKEAFARMNKPEAQPDALDNPSVGSELKNLAHQETHIETSMNAFNDKFADVRKIVDFSQERVYLEDYLFWAVENGADQLPCLGKATGCTTKKEEILRQSREENLPILDHLDIEGGDPNALIEAAQRARNAEELLMMAIKATVPVPIGNLQGRWTLYCPKYADTHFDKYGYGQRKLDIFSISGFKHANFYTARLSIPPRSMLYSTRAFSTPPHASFRTTVIKTAAEGYSMDIVFLGNGYLQLRVDLNLLLKGKATEEIEGKKVHMEFIGVHENAVEWWHNGSQLREHGKNLLDKAKGD